MKGDILEELRERDRTAFNVKESQNILSKPDGSKLHFNMVSRFISVIKRKISKSNKD